MRVKAENGPHRDTEIQVSRISKAKLPTLPFFDENKDKMDTYLYRFEIFAKSSGWPNTQWATYLSALLKGRALEVYCRLSIDDISNYDVLKDSRGFST